MEYIVIAFRSRAHTVRFYEFLKSNKIPSEIVNTPKEAGVGCGLSVKINKNYFSVAKNAVKIASLSSFAGFFLVSDNNKRRTVKTI